MSNVVVKLLDGFEMPIPELFEKIWEMVSKTEYQQGEWYSGPNQQETVYTWAQRSTYINAYERKYIETGVLTRCIIIHYKDMDNSESRMVVHHSTEDGNYKFALPLTRLFANPHDKETL